jgi:outer membrane immunogenic protein
MKKIWLLLVLLPFLAVAGHAQESRQDVSVSGTAQFFPFREGNSVQQKATLGIGVLASYRYMLTPNSAVEANYEYTQDTQKYLTSNNAPRVHTRIQEVSAAYVYTRNYRNWNPFVEAGIGGFIFTPLLDTKTQTYDTPQTTVIGGIGGAGVAYEISPSFDIRAEYRAQILKDPDLIVSATNNYKTGKYNWVSNPVIGVSYHF